MVLPDADYRGENPNMEGKYQIKQGSDSCRYPVVS